LALLRADLGLDWTPIDSRDLVAVLTPLSPHLIYFRQDDVDATIRTISAERGETWVASQTNWKLSSPYAVRRGLSGIDGLVTPYCVYRAITDQLFDDLEMAKLCIENSLRHWSSYVRLIDQTVLRIAP
jgi:hypothetical protein